MKVLLLNGSPRKNGCTFTALTEVANTLQNEEIEAEIFHIGAETIHGCIGCGRCRSGAGKCVAFDDVVNEVAEKAKAADGLIIGSPVYYASPNGTLMSALDRLFFSNGKSLAYKPGAAVLSARRAGATSAFDAINKYFSISNMPIVSSRYWNMVFGMTPEAIKADEEGLLIMQTLGKNMAWMLKSLEAAKAAGVTVPSL